MSAVTTPRLPVTPALLAVTPTKYTVTTPMLAVTAPRFAMTHTVLAVIPPPPVDCDSHHRLVHGPSPRDQFTKNMAN